MSGIIDTFAHRLSSAILIRNIKPIELSKKTGISKSKISSYMSGRFKAKQDGIYLLAKALNVDPAWLMGYDISMDGVMKISEINLIDLKTNEIIKKIPYSYNTSIAEENPKNYFAIYASDNSMSPLLDIGDIAIIKKYNKFINKKTYLLKVKVEKPNLKNIRDIPIIRKIIKSDNGDIELQAFNMSNFPPIQDLKFEDIEILGKVVKTENESAFK